ncbi:MAG: hypothetical protein LBJ67_02345 [Planctomycetaceae bacterium]|jgi:hypothetical protein|nr:hypothetical protein [Planctomycetaceae bacterium]
MLDFLKSPLFQEISNSRAIRVGIALFLFLGLTIISVGCGTAKWSDTTRTGTEQLLLTNAMDRAVGKVDFRALNGKTVWVDSKAIADSTDSKYFISTIRQHLLASGAKVTPKEEDADYTVELRAGAIGTDRNDLMVGVPSFSVPTGWATENFLGGSASVPEIAVFKKTEQRAVVKVAVFAYNRKNNAPIWQSGNIQTESRIKARWIFGAGPWSTGDVSDGTELAGTRLNSRITQIIDAEAVGTDLPAPSVTMPVFYVEHDAPEKRIPKPELDQLPTAATTPESSESKQATTSDATPAVAKSDSADNASHPIRFASGNIQSPPVANVPDFVPASYPQSAPDSHEQHKPLISDSPVFPWQQ